MQRPIQRRIYVLECSIFRLAKPAFFRYNENLHWDMRLYYKYLRIKGTKVIDSIKDEANEIIKKRKKLVNFFANIQGM